MNPATIAKGAVKVAEIAKTANDIKDTLETFRDIKNAGGEILGAFKGTNEVQEVIHIKTINENLEGQCCPETGVLL